MSTSESKPEIVLELAEEFIERYRRGERPPLQEYIDRHPELAAEIREAFPAMAMMENIAVADESLAGDRPSHVAKPSPDTLKQLGDYRIIREIGRGGMGFVYEAEQVSLGRHVALKLLPSHALHDAKQKRRFEREARAAAKLHHTNIVPVFGVGEHDGVPYYVMQFIQGLGLDSVLEELNRLLPGTAPTPTGMPAAGEIRVSRRDVTAADVARSLMTGEFQQSAGGEEAAELDPHPGFAATAEYPRDGDPQEPAPSPKSCAGGLSDSFTVSSPSIVLPGSSGTGRKSAIKKQTYWQSVANIGRQVAEALEYAHQQGIHHREIKPSNLLLDMRGTVWVTDFGLAKVAGSGADDLTRTGDVIGTLRYMPPEAFEGNSDARSDIYALGLTLYELLAMRPAFDEKDRNKLIKQMTAGEPMPLDKVRREIPRDLVTIVHKSIAREPSRRYATAEDMAADLQRFLDDEPILARRQTQLERYLRWARHHPSIAVLGGVLTAVLVLVTAASLLAAGYFNQLRWNEALAARNEKAARHEAELSREAESLQRQRADDNAKKADDNAKKAEERAGAARKAEQEAGARATAEAAANALAQREKQRADDNAKKADYNAKKAEERAGAVRRAEEEAKVQLARAQWLVYAGKLSLAQTDFETGTGALALHYLDECQWNLRGWEHRYLWTRINTNLTLGHGGPVTCTAFSPDGKRILTGGWGDDTAKVWDAETGKELLCVRVGVAVRGAAFSPDNKRFVTGVGDVGRAGEVKVWDAKTGKELLALKGPMSWVWCVAFSPDGKRIVAGGGDLYKPGEAKVWNAETGQEVFPLKGHGARVWSVAFSPDGKRIVTGSDDRTAKVWDAETGQELRTLKEHSERVSSVTFSPDGKRIATGSWDRTVMVWAAETGQEVLTLKGNTGWVMSAAFSPDGKRIVSGNADDTVRVWDAATGQEILALKGHAGHANSVAFSPDGKHIVSGSDDHTARVWDAERGQKVLTLNGETGPVRSLAFSPDSKRIVSASGVWDAATGRKLLALKGAGPIRSVAFSADGRRIVTGGQDNTARVWDAATGQELLALKGHRGHVLSVAFSPDVKRIATAAFHQDEPGAVKVWDAATGRIVLALDGLRARVWSVAFSPDGKRIVTGDDRTARVWDAGTGREILALEGHTHEVWSVAYSKDGKHIVTGCLDKMVRVFHAGTGKIVLALEGHTEGVWSAAMSPDGKRIFSGSEDDTVRVWDAGKGQELLALKWDSSVLSVALSPDGKRLAAGSEDGTVRVWVAEKGQPPRNDAERTELLKDRLPAQE